MHMQDASRFGGVRAGIGPPQRMESAWEES